MRVRHAQPQDAGVIHQIAAPLKIDYKNPQAHGFLIYVLDEEQYRKKIVVSPFFYVVEVGEQIKGFLMCYDDKTLQELVKEEKMSHEGNLPRFILQQPPPYVFIDQIGVQKTESKSGLGTAMVETLFEEMRSGEIPAAYVAVAHEPVRNTASMKFFQKHGFRKISEIDNGDGHKSGIYRVSLSF